MIRFSARQLEIKTLSRRANDIGFYVLNIAQDRRDESDPLKRLAIHRNFRRAA